MKKVITIAVSSILTCIVLYGTFSFVTLTIDFRLWSMDTRFFYAMFVLVAIYACFAIVNITQTK